jgi:hypothetical protein
MQGRAVICHSCGKELEHKAGCMPCEELTGWITVSIWKGKESVDHHNFCSIGCLQIWVEDQSPTIPEIFLKAFDEETSGS